MARKSNLIDLTCTDSEDDNLPTIITNSSQRTNKRSSSISATATPSSSTSNSALLNTILINGVDDFILNSDLSQSPPPQTRKKATKKLSTNPTAMTSNDQNQDLRFLRCVQNASTGGKVQVLKPQNRPVRKVQTHPVVILVPDNSTTPVVAASAPTPPHSTQTSEKKCPICLDPMVTASVTICGHVYCTECISSVVKSTKQCPICRKKLSPRGFHPIYL